jgi:hypothetical protein
MVQRLAGAVVAIAAAALLVAGAVTSAWWVGETTSGGAQTVAIGLRSEQVCHLEHTASGKPRCTATTTTDCDSSVGLSCRTRGTLDHEAIFGAAGWLATVMGALAALLLAVAAASSVRGRDGGRGAVNAGAIVGAIGGIGAVVFIVMRPSMSGVDGALAWPAYAFLGGAVASVLASIIVRFEPSERPVHHHAPAGPVRIPAAMSFDVAAMFADDEPGTKTDPTQEPPEMALAPAVRVVSEPRADTEKDLPPEGMQRTPAPPVIPAPPPAPIAPPVVPARPKPASLPPLPLPRTKPPSLPPPFKPPSTPSGTGPAPRIAAPEARDVKPPPLAPSLVSAAGPVPACSQCDAPTVWNEEHLRFYCRKCRIYL